MNSASAQLFGGNSSWRPDVTPRHHPGRGRRCSSTSRSSGCCASSCPQVATHTVAAVTAEVPGYTGALERRRWATTSRPRCRWRWPASSSSPPARRDADPSTPLGPTLEGAYALGRGEARSGRSMDALLAAYRVGARVAWRELAALARAGRASRRARWRSSPSWCSPTSTSCPRPASPGTPTSCPPAGGSGSATASGWASTCSPAPVTTSWPTAAERAGWPPPTTLTAVLLPLGAGPRVCSPLLDAETLVGRRGPARTLRRPAAGSRSRCSWSPTRTGPGRRHLLRVLAGRQAVVGPARPWTQARASYDRAVRTAALAADDQDGPIDSEDHLAQLVVRADPDALADLRARVLAPLADLRPGHAASGSRRRLRSWLLHQGRRDAVAADAARARADGALPDGPAARAVRRPARRPGDGARPPARAQRQSVRRLKSGLTNVDGGTWQSRHHVARQRSPRHGRPPSS